MRKTGIVLSLLAALFCVACSPTSSLVISLQALEIAVAAALPILTTTGMVSPVDLPILEERLNAIAEATSKSAAELSSNDTDSQKFLKISGYFVDTVLPVAGLNPTAAAILEAVNAAIRAFLAQVQMTHSAAVQIQPRMTKFSLSDKMALHDIEKKANSLSAQINALE